MALKRATAAHNRIEAARSRADLREWVVKRRERTHRLIQLGGLVEKSGLIPLLGDDDPDATLLGGLLMLRAELLEANVRERLAMWRRRGQRAFRQEWEDCR